MKKRIISLLLTAVMLLSLLPVTAMAGGDGIAYIERSWNGSEVTASQKTCTSFSYVKNSSTTWNAGWYVVNANTTISSAITVSGDVHLILYDNVTLTAQKGIVVNGKGNNSLTIYGQSGDSGRLITTGSSSAPYGAGIGGGGGYTTGDVKCGTVIIHGGTVNATGCEYGAGIGGGVGGAGGTVTIYGGKVTGTAPESGAGIGGGRDGAGGTVTIYGGEVTANGHNAGIDGGNNTVTIFGGTIKATSNDGGSIRGKVTVNGGAVTAISNGGTEGTGIGGDALTVNGGTVTSTGKNYGAGIGSSAVTVNAGNLTATGGEWGPGISGSTLTVNGGEVSAFGRYTYAGIASAVTVNGGKVTAVGGDYATFEGIPAGISGTVSFGENFSGGVLAGASAENAFYMSKADYCADHSANYVTMPVDAPTVATIVETETSYDSVQTAINAAGYLQTVRMEKDVTENLNVAEDKSITLDLNGKVLTGNGNGSVVVVNGMVTLADSAPAAMHDNESLPAGGVITGGTGSYVEDSVVGIGGGGVLVNEYGSFTMIGGTIIDNSARYGGGVFVCFEASFTMTGGTITGNTVFESGEFGSEPAGGGVYFVEPFPMNYVTLGGTAKIIENSGSNLYLGYDSAIQIREYGDNAPAQGMSVGVTTENGPYEGTPVTFAAYALSTDAKYFFADNEYHAVTYDEGQLWLVEPGWEDYYPVEVCDIQINRYIKDDVLHDGGSVSFDPDTNTLTLNNMAIGTDAESSLREAIKSELPAGKTLTVKLIGTNVIGRAPDEEYEEYTVKTGLFIGKGMTKAAAADGSLLLIGDKDSSLTIYASGDGISSGDTSFGEDGKDGKKFEGELKIYSDHNAIESRKSVFANGGKIFMESQNQGIHTKGDVTVSDGELTIRAENRGISASGAVTISGGKLDVTGGEDNCAIFADGGFSITSTDCQIIARGSDPDYGAIYSGSAPSFAEGLTMLGSTDKNAAKENITATAQMVASEEEYPYGAYIGTKPAKAVTFKLVRQHTTHDEIEFQPWVPADHDGALLPNVAGSWYLTGDITLENPDPHAKSGWDVPEGTTNLCLNGTMLSLVSRIRIPAGATLNLYDCGNEEHEGYIKDHRWIPDEVEGGTKKSVYGGCILALADQALLIETNGTLNMYGGTVTGYRHNGVLFFTSVVTGPSVYTKGGRFNMYGGTITGNCSFNAYGVDNVKYQGIVRLETLTGVTIGKDAVIDENYVSKLDSATSSYVYEEVNLAVPADQLFTLGTGANAPTAKMHVGISSVTAPVLGAPVVFTGANAGENDASRFESNMEGIHIERRKNNALYLCVEGEPAYVPHECVDKRVKVDGQVATCTEDGWKDYYKCTTCETLYSDEAMTAEITDLAAWKTGDGKIEKAGHDFAYSASGTDIIASYTNAGCPDGKVTLSLTANGGTYDGTTAYAAELTDLEDFKTVTGAAVGEIRYYKSGAEQDSAPVNAGNYTAKVTVTYDTDKTVTAVKNFTVEKAELTVTAKNKSIVYGDAAANNGVEYTGFVNGETEAKLGGTLTYAYRQSVTPFADYTTTSPVGTYDIIPSGLTSDNYKISFVNGTLTVNRADITPEVSITGWTYGNTANDPSVTGNSGSGAVTYEYKVKNADDSTYTTDVPTNAGDYTVRATVAETTNYNGGSDTADFTIAKASQATPAANEGYTLNYAAETLTATTGYEVSSTNSENATALPDNKVTPGATYYVRKPASDTNHADSAWTKITIPARPAATDLTGTMETIKNKKDASLSGVTSAMEYRMGTETNWTAGTGAVIANPDNLTIYVRTRATTGAFAGETQTIEFTPGDKLLTVTMGEAAQNVAYGGKLTKPSPDPTRTGYTFGGWYVDENCTQAWNFAIDTVKDNMTLYPKWIENAVQKAVITGNVTESDVNVPDATVELYLGTIKVAATVTNDSGNYSFDNVENGTYNIVVTKADGKTKTELVTVDSTGSFSANVELPTKAVSSKVEHKGTAVADAKSDIKETVVGGLDIIASNTNAGSNKVTIKLTVEPKAESEVTGASDIKALAGSGKKVEFLDLSLWEITTTDQGSESRGNIGGNNNTLLTIVVPFDFSGVDVSSVMILRNHGGNTEKLTKNPVAGQEGFTVNAAEGTITIYAMKFSDYAVAYAEQSTGGHGGGSYTPGHTVTSDLKNVTKVTIDGKVVDSKYYTVTGGNVYLTGEFMKTLTNGKHTVKLYNGLKTATGTITVVGNTNVVSAATGDAGLALYAALSVSSILGMGWLGKKKRGGE